MSQANRVAPHELVALIQSERQCNLGFGSPIVGPFLETVLRVYGD
jgi:hypothetical protein